MPDLFDFLGFNRPPPEPPAPEPPPPPLRKPTAPVQLTDAQMSTLMRAAEPLVPAARKSFLEAVAGELEGKEIGDGTVARVCARLQRVWLRRHDGRRVESTGVPGERLCRRPDFSHVQAICLNVPCPADPAFPSRPPSATERPWL